MGRGGVGVVLNEPPSPGASCACSGTFAHFPRRELAMTGLYSGTIIEHNALSCVRLGRATGLRRVIHDSTSKIHTCELRTLTSPSRGPCVFCPATACRLCLTRVLLQLSLGGRCNPRPESLAQIQSSGCADPMPSRGRKAPWNRPRCRACQNGCVCSVHTDGAEEAQALRCALSRGPSVLPRWRNVSSSPSSCFIFMARHTLTR